MSEQDDIDKKREKLFRALIESAKKRETIPSR